LLKQQHGTGLVNTIGRHLYIITLNFLQFLMQAQKMPAPPAPQKLPSHTTARKNAPYLQKLQLRQI